MLEHKEQLLQHNTCQRGPQAWVMHMAAIELGLSLIEVHKACKDMLESVCHHMAAPANEQEDNPTIQL